MLVKIIREAEAGLGSIRLKMLTQEKPIADVARKSIVSRFFIPKGERLTREMLDIKRPGTGLSPALFENIIGKETRKSISADVPIRAEMIKGG
jgi:N-acetylneuraminate synthase/N,N'-diacetyllegionaminate synthase